MVLLTFVSPQPLISSDRRRTNSQFGHSTSASISNVVASANSSHPLPPKSRRRRSLLQTVLPAIAAVALPFLPSRPIQAAQYHSHPAQLTHELSHVQSSRSRPVNTPLLIKTTRTPAAISIPKPIHALFPNASDPNLHKALKVALLAFVLTSVTTAITIAVFWIIQDSLVYKPTSVWRGNPGASGMPYYEDVTFTTRDGEQLTGWFIKQPPHVYCNARTMIYFHGTDKNACFRLKKVIGFYEQCQCNILLVSYRGYGISTGHPNERGFRIDAESAYDYLKSRSDINVAPGGNLWVYGESLGGAVAVHFANVYQTSINALILENTFTSLLDMIKLEFPILGIFRYLSRNRWQSSKRIGKLKIPLLFLSGLKDSYIPPAMMKKMHALAVQSPMKEFIKFERGTHNRTWTMDGFYEAVARFMDRVDAEKNSNRELDEPKPISKGTDDGGRVVTAV